jgi:hypothetical protein
VRGLGQAHGGRALPVLQRTWDGADRSAKVKPGAGPFDHHGVLMLAADSTQPVNRVFAMIPAVAMRLDGGSLHGVASHLSVLSGCSLRE